MRSNDPLAIGVTSCTSHVQQLTTWDCGLACVSMVLLALGKPLGRLQELHAWVQSDNIWTIDLAYLLHRYKIQDFSNFYPLTWTAMYTSYIGVNLQNASKTFYRNSLTADRQRIHTLFANARDKQVRVAPMILDLDDARRFLLSCRYAIIMLVNLSDLSCIQCSKAKSRPRWWWNAQSVRQSTDSCRQSRDSSRTSIESMESCSSSNRGDTNRLLSSPVSSSPSKTISFMNYISQTPQGSSTGQAPLYKSNLDRQKKPFSDPFNSFLGCCVPLSSKKSHRCGGTCCPGYELLSEDSFEGHYILLVGFDKRSDTFYYRDPGTQASLCSISGLQLQEARSASGTDHDAIVVKVK